jgi:hypothetical protein
MLAHAIDSWLQLAGTGSGLQLKGDAEEWKTGHMPVPVTVTPMGANVCPGGQYIGLKTVMKYAAW